MSSKYQYAQSVLFYGAKLSVRTDDGYRGYLSNVDCALQSLNRRELVALYESCAELSGGISRLNKGQIANLLYQKAVIDFLRPFLLQKIGFRHTVLEHFERGWLTSIMSMTATEKYPMLCFYMDDATKMCTLAEPQLILLDNEETDNSATTK